MKGKASLLVSLFVICALLMLLANTSHVSRAAGTLNTTLHPFQSEGPTAVPVGPESSSQGIVAVEVINEGKDTVAFFTHRIPSRSGKLRIYSEQEPNRVFMTLFREGKEVLSLQWDRINKEVWLSDSLGEEAYFKYDSRNHRWVSVKPDSQVILKHYQIDIQIMAAIHADLTENKAIWSQDVIKGSAFTEQCAVSGHCPCTGSWERGFGLADSRSWCCYQATNDVNSKCWNQWCIGCCRLLDCDAACLIGDYICFCGRSGQECGGPCN